MRKMIWRFGAEAILIVMLITAAGVPAQGQTYKVLHSFSGQLDGAIPAGGLIHDAAGNLYGTTFGGGPLQKGTVFMIDKVGKESLLYSFDGSPDGSGPVGNLLRVRNEFYGTTTYGGLGTTCSLGCGTVFVVNTAGREAVFYSFAGGTDGAYPQATLVQDAAGNLYGTTVGGGSSCDSGLGCGTVFKLQRSGAETVLHSFGGGTDGQFPIGGVLLDSTGDLYGTALYGGDTSCSVFGETGCGIVFKVGPTGKETILYGFTGAPDGAAPNAGLVQDSSGNSYGTTYLGGDLTCNSVIGCGTVFTLDSNGKETVLYRFAGGVDGAFPLAGLVRDVAGNLYGTTEQGGNLSCNNGQGCGTVFELDTVGALTVLHSFSGGTDGEFPEASLLRDGQGNLYGTTVNGGASNDGVVFGIKP